MNCIELNPTKEIINYVKQFNSDEELLRSGGIPIEMLDNYAYGFSENDITTIDPSKIKIKWKEDYENVMYEIKNSGLRPIEWAKKINLSEPIDLSYENLGKGLNFYLEDGHHRYVAAKLRKQPLNVNLTIKYNPIKKITKNKLSYDDFHRCLFKEVKNTKNFIKEKLREQLTNNYRTNTPLETLCNKMSIGSYEEAIQLVSNAMLNMDEITKVKIMKVIQTPLENLRQAQNGIEQEIKKYHMSGDSMPDQANTYWHQIQSTLCEMESDFQ